MSRIRLSLILCFLLSACNGLNTLQGNIKAEEATSASYRVVSFNDLPGWSSDRDMMSAANALTKSCAIMARRPPETSVAPGIVGGQVKDWLFMCNELKTINTDARTFFEKNFVPYQIVTPNGPEGLFTGYYEKIIHGSRVQTAKYHVPIYKRPEDLVMVELGDFRPELKGQRIAGKVNDGKLEPYADRKAIDEGALKNRHLELAWTDDENAAFFLHVQGSGRVVMDDGSVMRIGYDGQNGYVYKAIGRELIARGELTPETTSLDTIRAWLVDHPREAAALRWTNPSYIFFREIAGDINDGPMGAQGVGLTPERSLAVDPRFIPYGAPVFIDAPHPVADQPRMQRLLIAQDTGGAIRGPVRGDVFWGAGDWGSPAAQMAGVMKSRGEAYILLPKAVHSPGTVTLP
jgi:membrane-bound lytic murein transglycosylase A